MIVEDILQTHPDLTAEELKDFYGYYFDSLSISDYEEILQEIRDYYLELNNENIA